jgi:hypothetical protein
VSGKYVMAKASGSGGTHNDSCSERTGAVWDAVSDACWRIVGEPIIIEDKFMTVQAGFERVNANFQAPGTLPPVPTQFNLG